MAQNGTWPYDDSSWWSWWWDDQEESDSSWWWDDNEESAELKDLRDQVKAHEDKLNLLLQHGRDNEACGVFAARSPGLEG